MYVSEKTNKGMASFAHTINVKDMRYPMSDAVHVREEKNFIIENVVSDISDYLSDSSDYSSFSEYSSGYEEMIPPLTKMASTNKIMKLPHSFVKLERCDHLLTLFPGKTFYGTCDVTSLTSSLSSGRSRRPANLFYSQDFVVYDIDDIYSSTYTMKVKTAKKSKYCPKKSGKKQNAEQKKTSFKNFNKNKKNCVKNPPANESKEDLACVKGRDFFVSDSRSEGIPNAHPVPVYMTYVKDDICTTVYLHNENRVTQNAPIGRGFAACDRSKDVIIIDASDEESDIDVESNCFATNFVSDKEIIDHDHSYAIVYKTIITKLSEKNQASVSNLSLQTKTNHDENKSKLPGKNSKVCS